MTQLSNRRLQRARRLLRRTPSRRLWLYCALGSFCSACLDDYSRYDFVDDASADRTAPTASIGSPTAPSSDAPVATAPSTAPTPTAQSSGAPSGG